MLWCFIRSQGPRDLKGSMMVNVGRELSGHLVSLVSCKLVFNALIESWHWA